MNLTIKQIKDLISNYDDNQELDFIGLEDIVITTKASILLPKKNLEPSKQEVDMWEETFYKPSTEFNPTRMVIPNDIMELLEWKDDKSTRAKLEAFANTLVLVWNPTSGLLNLDHKKLNNTTLSRALFITKTQGKKINPKDQNFNIDSIIDRIITSNLPYLKQKYYNNNN